MGILSLIFLAFFVWLVFKILAAVFYAGAYIITLPLKIVFSVFILLLCIPFGILGIFVGLVGIILPLLPFILLAAFLFWIVKSR